MDISQIARDKLKPVAERERKLTDRWAKDGRYALMRAPQESVRSIPDSTFALHHFADGIELFRPTEADEGDPEWWSALIESDRIDLLGMAVTAFVAQDDATIKARRPRRGWTPSDIRSTALMKYRDIVRAVLDRDIETLRSAVLDFQLTFDPCR